MSTAINETLAKYESDYRNLVADWEAQKSRIRHTRLALESCPNAVSEYGRELLDQSQQLRQGGALALADDRLALAKTVLSYAERMASIRPRLDFPDMTPREVAIEVASWRMRIDAALITVEPAPPPSPPPPEEPKPESPSSRWWPW